MAYGLWQTMANVASEADEGHASGSGDNDLTANERMWLSQRESNGAQPRTCDQLLSIPKVCSAAISWQLFIIQETATAMLMPV